MAVSMILLSPNGSFDFGAAAYEMPLITRRLKFQRKGVDGAATVRVISLTLSGFFEGTDHAAVTAKYQALSDVLKASDIKFTYNDGTVLRLNQQIVFLDSLDEPEDWKQYDGKFNITFHYLEEITATPYNSLAASYVSSAGTHTFSPTPLWSSKMANTKQSPHGAQATPSGVYLGKKVLVTLEGEIHAAGHAAMVSAIDSMRAAFTRDGTLNYGSWTNDVEVVSGPDFGPVLPMVNCSYTVVLGYHTTTLEKFSSVRTFTRIDQMPVIRHRPYCPTDFVKTNRSSGQFITYELMGKGESVSIVRGILAAEADNLVTAGGVDVPGGTEKWDDMEESVTVSIRKFHNTPVLGNIEDSN